MEIYLFIFVVTAALLPTDRLKASSGVRLVLLSVPFVLLVFMAGTRYETGNDWQPYHEYYEQIREISDNAENFEIGYRVFAYAAKYIGLGYSGFILVSTVVYMTAFFVAFRRQNGVVALALLFYCTYLLGWMGTARQVIALGLTACAGECLLDRRRAAFIALTVLAATFHQTAILFLLAWFLRGPMLSTRAYLFLTVTFIAAGQALTHLLPWMIDRLAGTEGLGEKLVFYGQLNNRDLNQAAGSILGVLWYVKRLAFLALFLALRIKFTTRRQAFYFNAYFVSVAFFLLLNPVMPILATRGADYFSIYELFLLAALTTARTRIAALAIPLVIVLAGQRLYTALYAYHPDLYIPYKGLFINHDFVRDIY